VKVWALFAAVAAANHRLLTPAAVGPPENLESVLPRSTAAYLVTATISTLLGAGIVWFALEVLPSLL